MLGRKEVEISDNCNENTWLMTLRSLTCGIVKKIAVVVVSEKKTEIYFLKSDLFYCFPMWFLRHR